MLEGIQERGHEVGRPGGGPGGEAVRAHRGGGGGGGHHAGVAAVRHGAHLSLQPLGHRPARGGLPPQVPPPPSQPPLVPPRPHPAPAPLRGDAAAALPQDSAHSSQISCHTYRCSSRISYLARRLTRDLPWRRQNSMDKHWSALHRHEPSWGCCQPAQWWDSPTGWLHRPEGLTAGLWRGSAPQIARRRQAECQPEGGAAQPGSRVRAPRAVLAMPNVFPRWPPPHITPPFRACCKSFPSHVPSPTRSECCGRHRPYVELWQRLWMRHGCSSYESYLIVCVGATCHLKHACIVNGL